MILITPITFAASGGPPNRLTNPIFQGTFLEYLLAGGQGAGSSFFGKLIPTLVGILLTIGAILFFFYFIYGAINYITAGGDKGNLESARTHIKNALVGLILMISVFAVTKLVESIFGLNILTIDIGPLVIK